MSEWEVNKGGEKKEYLSKFVKKRKDNKEFNMASNGENWNPNMASNGENWNPNMASNGENRNPNMASNRGNSNGVVPPGIWPTNEILGGYIFVCDNETMEENLRRQIFCMRDTYQDSVRLIVPGLTLFLYNHESSQLHGIFEATSFGGTNIDPSAFPDNNNPGRSRFPAQVRVRRRRMCQPLEYMHMQFMAFVYDDHTVVRFRTELTVPETNALVESFNDEGTP